MAANGRSYESICSTPASHEDADLCQQWRSANAANDSAKFAFWQLVLGAIGAAAVGATVLYSAETLRLQNRTSRAELRAYVSLAQHWISSSDATTLCRVTIAATNSGNTPARNLRRAILIRVINDVTTIPLEAKELRAPSGVGTAIPGNGGTIMAEYASPVSFTPMEIAGIVAKTHHICVYVASEYADVFGDLHEERMAFFAEAEPSHLIKLTSNHLGRDLEVKFIHIEGYHHST